MAAAPACRPRSVAVQPLSSTRVQPFQLAASAASAPNCVPTASGARRLRRPRAWLALLLLLLLLAAVEAAPVAREQLYVVLVSVPVLDKVLPLKSLAEELLHRGYRIGFALPENCRHWVADLDGLEFISLGNIVPKGRATYRDAGELQTTGPYESYLATLRFYSSFQRPMLAALLEDLEDDRPDMLIVDRHSFAGFDAADVLHLPYVVNNPHMLLDMDSPPAYVPAPFTNYSMHTPSVLERCLNGYYRLQFRLALVRAFADVNQVRADHGLAPISDKQEMVSHQLVLANSAFGLEASRPMAPHFAMVGLLRSRLLTELEASSKPGSSSALKRVMPSALVSWLEQGGNLVGSHSADRDLVYISFPPDVPLAPEFVTQLLDALEHVDVRVLWKVTLQERAAFDLRARPRDSVFFLGEGDLEPGVADALVLTFARISAVITSGNLNVVQEALIAGIPIIGIPFSADQLESVNAVARSNAGLVIAPFSAQDVHDSIQRLLNEPAFTLAAKRLGQIVTAAGGTPRAVDAIEAVLMMSPDGRRGDTTFLLPMRNIQPLYKTYLVDVYLVYSVILCGAFVILRTFLSVVLAIFQPLVDEMDLEDLEEEERAALAEATGRSAPATNSGVEHVGGRRKLVS